MQYIMNIVVVMPVIFNCTYCNKKAKLLILEDYRAKWEHFAFEKGYTI